MDIIKSKEHKEFRKYFLTQLDEFNQENHKIIVSYFGLIQADFIQQFIESLEHYLIERKIEPHRIKKLYSTTLHSLNNMLLYGELDSENQKLIGFFITLEEDRYHIYSCNLILEEKQAFLTDYITEINNLDKNEIELRYNQAIENSFTSKDKNGIGLITMRYHSEEPLKFSFQKSDQKILFSLEMC